MYEVFQLSSVTVTKVSSKISGFLMSVAVAHWLYIDSPVMFRPKIDGLIMEHPPSHFEVRSYSVTGELG
jgi:hypothetical protein